MNTHNLNDVELLARIFIEAGERRGPFHHATLTADGQVQAVWLKHKETFTPENLRVLLATAKPAGADVPEWQVKLGQALAHKSRGELAEARRLELEAVDLLLPEAYRKIEGRE